MRELHYGSSVLTTTFDVCTELFNYSLALLKAERQAYVEIPILLHGLPATSKVMLGIPVPMHCEPSAEDDVDLRDADLIEQLREEVAALTKFGRSSNASPVNNDVYDHDLIHA